MKKFFYKLITPVRKFYWFLLRPKTFGVKVIVECHGKLLLIKNAYGKGIWTFPGGGVSRNESPEDAAKREVREEVGITVSRIQKIGELVNTREYKRDTIYCFVTIVEMEEVAIDPNEILEAQWFDKDRIPSDISSIAQAVLSLKEKLSL